MILVTFVDDLFLYFMMSSRWTNEKMMASFQQHGCLVWHTTLPISGAHPNHSALSDHPHLWNPHSLSYTMVIIILHCHKIMMLLFGGDEVMKKLLLQTEYTPLPHELSLLGIWNLDFIGYIILLFCVSSRFLPSHIILNCSTTILPLIRYFNILYLHLH